jgi:hypothetical protein
VSFPFADLPYYGATSRAAINATAHLTVCSGCGSDLRGRLERVDRTGGFETRVWLCGCGRRHRLRREVAPKQ